MTDRSIGCGPAQPDRPLFLIGDFAVASNQQCKDKDLHVAIIMDGNGRWANIRGLPREAGHHAGVAALREVTEAAAQRGIGTLTVYAFSADNWRRPDAHRVNHRRGMVEEPPRRIHPARARSVLRP